MDRVLQALLRTELRFFIRKVFTTVSPGETYLHNWHVDAIAHQLMRVRSGESRRLLITNHRVRSNRSASRSPMSLGYSAMIRHATSSWRVIRATSRPNFTGSFAW